MIIGAPDKESAVTFVEEQSPAHGVIPSPSTGKPGRGDGDRYHASMIASKQASMLASYHVDIIEEIRKAVKGAGKEVSFVRLTAEEKRRLAGIVYTYKSQGTKTSENEINRIAVNLLLDDYEQNGEQSVLARVIAALAE